MWKQKNVWKALLKKSFLERKTFDFCWHPSLRGKPNCLCVWKFVSVCVKVCECVWECVFVCESVCMYVLECVFVCVCESVCLCVWQCAYVYVDMGDIRLRRVKEISLLTLSCDKNQYDLKTQKQTNMSTTSTKKLVFLWSCFKSDLEFVSLLSSVVKILELLLMLLLLLQPLLFSKKK